MNKHSKLLDGNLFECMRIILPEHRELMRELDNMAKAEPVDTFDEYKQIEMMETLQEAIENGLSVSITLKSGKHQTGQVITGLPSVQGQALYVGGQRVPVEKVVDVRRE